MKTYSVSKHDGTTDTITNATSVVEGDQAIDFLDDNDNVVAHYEAGVVDDWTEHEDAPAAPASDPATTGNEAGSAAEAQAADNSSITSSSAAAPTPDPIAPDAGTTAPGPDAQPPADSTGSAAAPVADSTPTQTIEPGVAELPNAGQGQPPALNVENPGDTGAVNHLPGGSEPAVSGSEAGTNAPPGASLPPAQEGSW